MSQGGIVSVSAASGVVDSVTGTNGIIASPTTGNVVVQIANRVEATAITMDDTTPVTVFTIPLGAVAGTYLFTTQVVAYDLTDSLGAGFSVYTNSRTTGSAAVLIGSNIVLESEEGAMSGISVLGVTDPVANDFSVQVIGLAGKTIHYRAVTQYIFIS